MFRSVLASLAMAALALPISTGCGRLSPPSATSQRLHEIQVLGSHNSYKQAIDPSLFELFLAQSPEVARSLEYRHLPLSQQLDRGLRQLELDVFADPDGGRYASPAGLAWVAAAGLPPGPPFDPGGEMSAPGLKVLHVQDLDFRSSCLTLQRCLAVLRRWSEEHSGHLPVVVTMNAKDEPIERPDFVVPLPFDGAALDVLDGEILAALGRERLLVPDDVRGDLPSLEQAVLTRGWPELDEVRGRFLFVLDEGGEKLETYIRGHEALAGRVMFVNAAPGRPEAAFLILNDPLSQGEEIRERVRQGYLVRTRADADTVEARRGEVARRDAAFSSGAQFVSTDYYDENPAFGTGYRVELPGGGVARCNPVTVESPCIVED